MASCRTVCFPRPSLPPVTRMTLLVNGGMSVLGVKVIFLFLYE